MKYLNFISYLNVLNLQYEIPIHSWYTSYLIQISENFMNHPHFSNNKELYKLICRLHIYCGLIYNTVVHRYRRQTA